MHLSCGRCKGIIAFNFHIEIIEISIQLVYHNRKVGGRNKGGKGDDMKMLKTILIVSFFASCVVNASSEDVWTWLYQKKFTEHELRDYHNKRELVFLKHGVPHFSQLLFSWNAFRPDQGHFTFYVQVRDAKRKTWGVWHKMAQWGAQVQRSFGSKPVCTTQYHHVRLESNQGHLSDAFRVRVEVEEGADLTQLRAFTISLSNFTKFKKSLVNETIRSLPSTYIARVPKQSQFKVLYPHRDSICSPTSLGMIIGYLTDQTIDYAQLARGAFDTGLQAHGSWPFNTAHAFEQCQGDVLFGVGRLNSFTQLHEQLEKKIPVVVSVRGSLDGAPQAYNKGHLMVVVGWDAKRQQVIVHDPAFKSDNKVLKRYSLQTFLRAWDRSHRLVYLADPVRAI